MVKILNGLELSTISLSNSGKFISLGSRSRDQEPGQEPGQWQLCVWWL